MTLRSVIKRFGDWFSFDVGGLDLTDYVEAIQRQFQIHLDQCDLESIQTVQDLCDLIDKKTGRITEPEQEETWLKVRVITSREFGVDVSEIRNDTRFIEELNC